MNIRNINDFVIAAQAERKTVTPMTMGVFEKTGMFISSGSQKEAIEKFLASASVRVRAGRTDLLIPPSENIFGLCYRSEANKEAAFFAVHPAGEKTARAALVLLFLYYIDKEKSPIAKDPSFDDAFLLHFTQLGVEQGLAEEDVAAGLELAQNILKPELFRV